MMNAWGTVQRLEVTAMDRWTSIIPLFPLCRLHHEYSGMPDSWCDIFWVCVLSTPDKCFR
ncbi:Uncharacterised protein [Klebsiella aerogenes]|nr:Uncharacterised protein [Klebsiella aerogenes]